MRRLTWLMVLGAAWAAAPACRAADAPRTDEPLNAEDSEDPVEDFYSMLEDPPFDRYVDYAVVGNALTRGDAGMLTNAALRAAEGERVLLRPRKGVTAEHLMRLAAQAAAMDGDAADLDRLAKGAKTYGMIDLLPGIESGRKLFSPDRSAGQGLRVNVEETPPQVFALLRDYRDQIRTARLLGDRNTLDALEAGLGTGLALSEAQRAYLTGLIADARKAAPEKQTPEDELLTKLAGASRGEEDDEGELANQPQQVTDAFLVSPQTVNTGRLPAHNRAVFAYCERRVGKRVGSGQCADLAQLAIEAATGRSFSVRGPKNAPGDYVWGREVAEITPRSRGVGALEPGDVLQFHGARFAGKITHPDGNWQSWESTADHHTAVVVGVKGDVITVFQENSDGKLYVTLGTYRAGELKAGWVKAYRP